MIHFDGGGSGMRNRDAALEPVDELVDGGGCNRVVRVELAPNPNGFGHACAERTQD